MIVTTTNNIEGMKIREYKGIVFGEVVEGMNAIKDMMAGFTDVFGGRSASYEDGVINARNEAITEMMTRAGNLGANAIIGTTFDYETIGSMVMIIATGTAVIVE